MVPAVDFHDIEQPDEEGDQSTTAAIASGRKAARLMSVSEGDKALLTKSILFASRIHHSEA